MTEVCEVDPAHARLRERMPRLLESEAVCLLGRVGRLLDPGDESGGDGDAGDCLVDEAEGLGAPDEDDGLEERDAVRGSVRDERTDEPLDALLVEADLELEEPRPGLGLLRGARSSVLERRGAQVLDRSDEQ